MNRRTHLSYAAFYSSKFVLLGVQLPFLSGWLALKGLSAPEIGLITGAALSLRLLFGPFVAYWADSQSDRLRGLRAIALTFALSAAALMLPAGKMAIAAAAAILMWSFGVLVPLTDSAVMRADRAGLANFGQARATGSLAFLMTTLAGGEALTRLGLGAAAPIMAAAAATTFLIGAALPRPAESADAPRRPNLVGDVKRLLSPRVFLLALAAAALVQGAHAVYYAFSILHWSSLGYSPRVVGALWATGVGAEIIMLTRMRALTRRLNPAVLIAAGAVGAVLRWTLIGLEPPLALLFLVQTLHALSFAATYVGTIEFLWRATPARLINSAMTLNSTAGVGAATGIATIVAGHVYAASGPQTAYFMMAAMAGAGLVLALILARRWRGEKLFD